MDVKNFKNRRLMEDEKLFTLKEVQTFVRWGIHQAYLADIYELDVLEQETQKICNQLSEIIIKPLKNKTNGRSI